MLWQTVDSCSKVHMNADITFVSFVENWYSSVVVSYHTNKFVIHVSVYACGHLKARLVGLQVSVATIWVYAVAVLLATCSKHCTNRSSTCSIWIGVFWTRAITGLEEDCWETACVIDGSAVVTALNAAWAWLKAAAPHGTAFEACVKIFAPMHEL
jgi:hypothetical protein